MQDSTYYYLNHDKKPIGPFTISQLEAKLSMGEIEASTLVAAVGGDNWAPLNSLLDTSECADSAPLPSIPTSTTMTEMDRGGAPDPNSSLWAHFTSCMRRFACFKGRATRKEYWSFILFSFVLTLPFILGIFATIVMEISPYFTTVINNPDLASAQQALDTKLKSYEQMGHLLESDNSSRIWFILILLLQAFFFIPNLAVSIRRFHDLGSTAWIPVISATLSSLGTAHTVIPFLSPELTNAHSLLSLPFALIILIFAFRDSQPGTNRYGTSTKYPTT